VVLKSIFELYTTCFRPQYSKMEYLEVSHWPLSSHNSSPRPYDEGIQLMANVLIDLGNPPPEYEGLKLTLRIELITFWGAMVHIWDISRPSLARRAGKGAPSPNQANQALSSGS